jgi:hypothetical protein
MSVEGDKWGRLSLLSAIFSLYSYLGITFDGKMGKL